MSVSVNKVFEKGVQHLAYVFKIPGMRGEGGGMLSIIDYVLPLGIYNYAGHLVPVRVAWSIGPAGVGEPADTREFFCGCINHLAGSFLNSLLLIGLFRHSISVGINKDTIALAALLDEGQQRLGNAKPLHLRGLDAGEISGPLENVIVDFLIICRNHIREREAFGVDDIGNDLAGSIGVGLVVIAVAVISIKHHIGTGLHEGENRDGGRLKACGTVGYGTGQQHHRRGKAEGEMFNKSHNSNTISDISTIADHCQLQR